MIQGDIVTIPLRTAAGYQANAFLIVHFTNGNPDMGRKVFQPERKELADEISRRVVSELRKAYPLLKPDSGATFVNPSKALDDWKDQQKEWQRRNPLRLEIEGRTISLFSLPREEQDVIALYHQLVGMGAIKGLGFYSTGYNTRYDGLYFYRYHSGHEYRAEQNFWGVDPNIVPSESGALVLEYKYLMDTLIDDFDKEKKNPRELNLVVCWDIGHEYKRSFEVSSFLAGQEGGTRENFGATHAIYAVVGRDTKLFEVLSLRDYVRYLQAPSEVIAEHASLYI